MNDELLLYSEQVLVVWAMLLNLYRLTVIEKFGEDWYTAYDKSNRDFSIPFHQ